LLAITNLGGDDLQAGRWLNAALLGALVILATLIVWRLTGRRRYAAAAGILLATSEGVLYSHLIAQSEPLFLLLTLATVWLLASGGSDPGRRKLAVVALLAGAAALTRYAGLALVATVVLYRLWQPGLAWRRRLGQVTLVAVAGVAPLLLWFARNAAVAQSVAGRSLVYHPLDGPRLEMATTTLSRWLLPGIAPTTAAAVALILVTAGLAWAARKQATLRPYLVAAGLFGLVYFAFLAVAISFYDAMIPLDTRILSPAAGVWITCLVALLAAAARRARAKPFVRLLPGAALLILIGFSLLLAYQVSVTSAREGLFFTSKRWTESPTMAYVRGLPAGETFFTNVPEAVYLITGRVADPIPAKMVATRLQANPLFDRQMQSMIAAMEREGRVLVYFESLQNPFLLGREELEASVPLRPLATFGDGVIYGPVE
jgi:4-amino-4-deoxy-L-arabinose transferase-like glycosyltransferase